MICNNYWGRLFVDILFLSLGYIVPTTFIVLVVSWKTENLQIEWMTAKSVNFHSLKRNDSLLRIAATSNFEQMNGSYELDVVSEYDSENRRTGVRNRIKNAVHFRKVNNFKFVENR